MLNTTTVKTKPTHKNLGRNAASAIISGCLALSLCPAIAFAAPGGEPPAMMQDSGYQDGSFNQGMPPAQSQNGGPSQSIGSPSDQNGGGQPTGQGNGAPQGQAPDMQQPANGTPDGQQPAQQPDSAQGQLSETATPNAGNFAKVENNNAPAQDDQARRNETPNLDGQNSQGSQGSSPESQRESQASLNNAPSNPSGDKPGYNRPNGNAPEGPSPTQQPQQPPSPSSGDPNPADRNKS